MEAWLYFATPLLQKLTPTTINLRIIKNQKYIKTTYRVRFDNRSINGKRSRIY